MALDQRLLDILVCPDDKGELLYLEDEDILYNPRLRRVYRITDGIPQMLPDAYTEADEAEHDRIVAKAG